MPNIDFFRSLVQELKTLFLPLSDALSDPSAAMELLRFHGWHTPEGNEVYVSIEPFSLLRDKLDQLDDILTNALGEPEGATELTFLTAFRLIEEIVENIQSWPQVAVLDLSPPFNTPHFWQKFSVQLLDYLQSRYLRDNHPAVYAPLMFTGVIEETIVEDAIEGEQAVRVRMAPNWRRITRLLEPQNLIAAVYGWGTNEFLFEDFIFRLDQSSELLGFKGKLRTPTILLLDRYYDLDNEYRQRIQEIYIPLVGGTPTTNQDFEIGVSIFPIPNINDRHGRPVGFGVSVLRHGIAPTDGTLGVVVTMNGGTETEYDTVLEVRPNTVNISVPNTVADVHEISVIMSEFDKFERYLIGARSGMGIKYDSYSVSLKTENSSGEHDVHLEISLSNAKLVVNYESADSFLKSQVGQDEIVVQVPLTMGISSKSGPYIGYSGSLSQEIIIERSLGGFNIERAHIALSVDSDVLLLNAFIDASIKMGPVFVSIQSTGITFSVDLSNHVALAKGSIEFGFKPPSGMGLLIDIGWLRGGGLLNYDDAAGRYFGALELEVYNVAIKAFGILDTRLPGGRPAYSFVILVSAEFMPIPLGLGFNLVGVGGLAGIHRSVDVEVLRNRLRSGAIDRILFPEALINDATQIVNDLHAVFPPAEDHYVFGPTARINWGTSALVTAKLGIVLELPQPGRIILIGRVRVALPRPDDALVELNLDVLGTIDPPRALVELEGGLIEPSYVGPFKLGGDFAFRLVGGESPNFALAIGGFNDSYQPPPNFPPLKRVAIPLVNNDNLKIILEGYLAITSNTFQIGAAVHVYAEASKVNIEGDVSFDTLITFSPLSFIADFSGKVTLSWGDNELAAIQLEAKISGPAPWRAAGEACLVIRWWPDICVPFDTGNFGNDRQIELPVQDPWPQLKAAIESAEGWSSSRPRGAYRSATIAAAPDSFNAIDPACGLLFRQPVVPLNRRITRFGQTKPAGGSNRFTIAEVVAAGERVPQWSYVEDFFAPALFEELSDDEKLSQPSFERMAAGFAMGMDAVNHGVGIGTTVDYKTKIIDSTFETRSVGPPYRPTVTAQLSALQRASAAQAPLRHTGRQKFTPLVIQPLVAILEERFIIASNINLAKRTDIVIEPATKGSVLQALSEHLASHPDQIGTLQVVSLDEILA